MKNKDKTQRAIYFIELKDGTKLYKCDSFWSTSKNYINAKVHDDSEYDQFRFFESFKSSFRYVNTFESSEDSKLYMEKFENAKYGYQIYKLLGNGDVNEVELSDPIYLTEIEYISIDGDIEAPSIKSYNRNININKILK